MHRCGAEEIRGALVPDREAAESIHVVSQNLKLVRIEAPSPRLQIQTA